MRNYWYKLFWAKWLRMAISLGALSLVVLNRADFATTDPAQVTPEMKRYLTHHEIRRMNPARIVQQIRRNGEFSLPTGTGAFNLFLKPHDLRASNYRAEESTGSGWRLPQN